MSRVALGRKVLKSARRHARETAYRVSGDIRAKFSDRSIRAYWYVGEKNFGDLLTPLLLRHYGWTPVFRPIHSTLDLVGAGSVLDHLPASYSGIILGTGFIHEWMRASFPRATILAARGRLTQERLMRDDVPTLGDPGLLAPRLMEKRSSKRFALGIVPHLFDKRSPVIRNMARRFGDEACVIDVCQEPLRVFRQIDACEHVVASSLHGLIVADSLGIPCARFTLSPLTGGDFKFQDYESAFGTEQYAWHALVGDDSASDLMKLTRIKPPDRIKAIQEGLDHAFRSMAEVMAVKREVG